MCRPIRPKTLKRIPSNNSYCRTTCFKLQVFAGYAAFMKTVQNLSQFTPDVNSCSILIAISLNLLFLITYQGTAAAILKTTSNIAVLYSTTFSRDLFVIPTAFEFFVKCLAKYLSYRAMKSGFERQSVELSLGNNFPDTCS